MKCPKCNVEAAITRSRYLTTGDDSPNEETKLFLEQTFTCRNQRCEDFGKEIGKIKNQLRLGRDE